MTDNLNIIILVNLDSNNKSASKKWQKISDQVQLRFPTPPKVITYHVPFDTKKCLTDLLKTDALNCIISAGGDGSANIILNELILLQKTISFRFSLGFIGLGSSNDILKPFKTFIEGIPIKISMDGTKKVDLCESTYIDVNNNTVTRYFLCNSSIGVGASANWLFNQKELIVNFLKSRWLNLTISYVTIKTILNFRNYPIELTYNKKKRKVIVSHMSIIKNPHISGNLKFDQFITEDDGQLGLNICENMTKWELIRAMMDLKKGQFSGKPKRHSFYVQELEINPKQLIPVEFDGEVELAKEIRYTINPKCINILN